MNFTHEELDDIDSALTDSMTLAEETHHGKPTLEEIEYLARIVAIQLRVRERMACSPNRPSLYEQFIVDERDYIVTKGGKSKNG